MALRLRYALIALALAWGNEGLAQALQPPPDDETVFLVAHPTLRDLDYRHAVLIATPIPTGGHVGVIINRPTRRSLVSLFPEHEPSKRVSDPVFYGGPFAPGALVALVKSDTNPGGGAVPLMDKLYMAFRANAIDRVIEQTPNDARYYIGYVGWRPGELRAEVDRGVWVVVSANRDTVFRKDMAHLWEELLAQSRRIQAARDVSLIAAR